MKQGSSEAFMRQDKENAKRTPRKLECYGEESIKCYAYGKESKVGNISGVT